jgi:hypothetical protein
MKAQIVGMTGMYCAAAELSRRGFIVAVTSRNAQGIDLLANHPNSYSAWTFQVKTNADKGDSWRLGQGETVADPNCFYIFVNLNGVGPPTYAVAESSLVAEKKKNRAHPYIRRADIPKGDGWEMFTSVAFRDLTWEDARAIAKRPSDHSVALLNKALMLLKPPQSNKLDRDFRKAIADEISWRTRAKPGRASNVARRNAQSKDLGSGTI